MMTKYQQKFIYFAQLSKQIQEIVTFMFTSRDCFKSLVIWRVGMRWEQDEEGTGEVFVVVWFVGLWGLGFCGFVWFGFFCLTGYINTQDTEILPLHCLKQISHCLIQYFLQMNFALQHGDQQIVTVGWINSLYFYLSVMS